MDLLGSDRLMPVMQMPVREAPVKEGPIAEAMALALPQAQSVVPPAPALRIVINDDIEAWNTAAEPVLPRTRKARALLALLAVSAPGRVSRLRAAGLLWSLSPRKQAYGSLRQAVHDLQLVFRASNVDVLEARRLHLRLRAEQVKVSHVEGYEPDQWLCSLRGVDPAFDTWIAEQADLIRGARSTAAGRSPAAAPGGACLRPRLGVMPFQVPNGVAATTLGAGLADEIATALSRHGRVALLSGLTLGHLRHAMPADPGATLGLDFLLDGTVQDNRAWLRITLRLHDLRANGLVIWAERYDRPARDLLTLQEEITAATVAKLDRIIPLAVDACG